MLTNASANRVLEHLNTFSIDDYKEQQVQAIRTDSHGHTFSTNIKNDKLNVENHLNTSSTLENDTIDQPLLIVLDDDDAKDLTEKNDCYAGAPIKQLNLDRTENISTKVTHSVKKLQTSVQHLSHSKSSRKARSPWTLHSSKKFFRTVVFDTSLMRQTTAQHHRHKLLARRKTSRTFRSTLNMSNQTKTFPLDDHSKSLPSNDSILSNISFGNSIDILTVSRMGCIFYCLEDLYSKVFTSLCKLEELTSLLTKCETIRLKQVTLSEKICIEQRIPSLKKFNEIRYRLLSINASDYLLKLKQLLSSTDENEKQREKQLEQIVDEMRNYKRIPTPVLLKDKSAHSPMTTKRLSSDDDDDEEDEDEPRKCLKIVTKKQKSNDTPSSAPTQFGIFIQCNGPVSCNIFSTNEKGATTTSTETTTMMTTTTVAKTDSDPLAKSTAGKKSNDNTQMYFDQFQQQYPKFSVNNEQYPAFTSKESHSLPDCAQLNKPCPSSTSTLMNMPIKRRILSSYNSDTSDYSSSTPTHLSSFPANHSRCLHRSKSFTYQQDEKKDLQRRASSLPSIRMHFKENLSSKRAFLTDVNVKSKAEPIDLTDESYSMPMIVNVEENVELANQRHRITHKQKTMTQRPPIVDPETRPSPSTVIPRSISREVNHPALTKPTPIHHPASSSSSSSSSYCPSPYVYYHQESYAYRDPSQCVPPQPSVTHPYLHSFTNPNNGSPYSYPFAPAGHYSNVKKVKESAPPNCYDTRLNSLPSTHPSPISNNSHNNNHSMSSVAMPIVRKPNYYHQLTPEQQASIKMQTSPPETTPCRLPCCYLSPTTMQQQQQQQQQQQHYPTEKSMANERLMYRQYSVPIPSPQTCKRDPSQIPDMHNSSPTMNRKQHRMDPAPPLSTTPYPSYSATKSYFVPPPPPPSSSSSLSSQWSSAPNPNMKSSIRYPYPPPVNTPNNGLARKVEAFPQPRRPRPVQTRVAPPPPPPPPPVVAQSSSTMISPPNTPHELTLPNVRTRSVDLQRAIVERGYCDMDKLPKLVVKHSKSYSNRTIDTVGQLFPTWFNEPDYRCIHCFRCDQVFTPQQFMTHVDDENVQNEQPVSMTSIQLLTSEKMSEYKVGLWNQFCTNLTIYAREGRIGGFSTNRNV